MSHPANRAATTRNAPNLTHSSVIRHERVDIGALATEAESAESADSSSTITIAGEPHVVPTAVADAFSRMRAQLEQLETEAAQVKGSRTRGDTACPVKAARSRMDASILVAGHRAAGGE